MSRVEIAREVGDDFDRIFDHLAEQDPAHAAARIRDVTQAINVLETNPLIGSPAPGDKRELIIGRGSSGHVALYRYVVELDTVFLLATRNQREGGFRRS